MKKNWKLLVGILIPLILLSIPTAMIPLDGITVTQHRVLAIFVFAVLFWVLEPIPVFATSVVIILLELIMVSTKGLVWLRSPLAEDTEAFGSLINYKDLLGTFSSPIIMLFLGGFFLAMAATKYRLDVNLARVLLKPFGGKPRAVLFGLMAITALFSMFMSNTATTAMMLAVLIPVLRELDTGDKGRIAFALSIPFAANIGGMGTPIGTPPNAVAAGVLTGDMSVDFLTWMIFSVPYVVVMLVVTWWLLIWFFPITTAEVSVKIESKWLKTPKAITVYILFILTILLWLTGKIHGMSSHVVAMIPVAVFVASNIVTASDLKKLSWDVLWLVAGGIALGLGLGKTGLSGVLVSAIPFDILSPMSIAVVAACLGLVMSTFMSNTATANLLIPIMVALGTNRDIVSDPAAAVLLIVAVTYACSLAMAMPISTPPNALASATGYVNNKDMMRSGLAIGFIGLMVAFAMIFFLKTIAFFG